MSTHVTATFEPARWRQKDPQGFIRQRAGQFRALGPRLVEINQRAKRARIAAQSRGQAQLAERFKGIQYRTHFRHQEWLAQVRTLDRVERALRAGAGSTLAGVFLGAEPPMAAVAVAPIAIGVLVLLAAAMAYLFYAESTERKELANAERQLSVAQQIVKDTSAGRITPEQASEMLQTVQETGRPASEGMGPLLKQIAVGLSVAVGAAILIPALQSNRAG